MRALCNVDCDGLPYMFFSFFEEEEEQRPHGTCCKQTNDASRQCVPTRYILIMERCHYAAKTALVR